MATSIFSIVNSLMNTFKASKTPAMFLPAMLARAVSIQRPGLSAYEITSKVIEQNKIIGIPTEPNPDGTANMINEYTYNIVKTVVEALQEEGVVQVVVPAGSLTIQAEGANAGGPVVAVGTNLLDSTAYGIIH